MGNFYWTNFESIWNHFDTVLSDWDNLIVEPRKQLSLLPKYPHTDCWIDEDGNNLYLRFALAGYDKDGVKVRASKNVLRVSAEGEKEEGVKFVHQGISKKDIDFSLTVDEAFELRETVVSFSQGLLTIQIPRAAEAQVFDIQFSEADVSLDEDAPLDELEEENEKNNSL